MLEYKCKYTYLKDGLLTLLLCYCIINPIDAYIPLKLPLFACLLVVCICFQTLVSINSLMPFIVIYSILIITSSIGAFMGYNTDYVTSFFFYRTFTLLLLIPWCKYFKVFKSVIYSLLIVFIICLSIYLLNSYSENYFLLVYAFLVDRLYGLVVIANRSFLGFDFFSVYYSSSCLTLIIFPYVFSIWVNNRKFTTGLISVILGLLIFIAGLRAIMLSGLISFVFVCMMKLYTRFKKLALFFSFSMMMVFALLAMMLLSEKDESSLDTKTTLAKAFVAHVNNQPETLIWGNGVGATYDSLGIRGREATASELFYNEIVRFFGLAFGCLFLFVYIYPLLLIYKKRGMLLQWEAISLGYISYLISGGTNPYMISSNGMIALIIMYSYALNPYYHYRKTL